ncbi:hypothetical protein FIC_00445 [Flavobacteriaceae bacterium 3519-10]|nr:hypothetical protein FIC_00445 [Flavobacteriaceae bacterium 3519-10]
MMGKKFSALAIFSAKVSVDISVILDMPNYEKFGVFEILAFHPCFVARHVS